MFSGTVPYGCFRTGLSFGEIKHSEMEEAGLLEFMPLGPCVGPSLPSDYSIPVPVMPGLA